MSWLRIIAPVFTLLSACAAPPAVRTLPQSPDQIRGAVMKVLSRCKDVKDEGNLIRTGNCPSPLVPGEPERLGNWRERHEIRLEGSTVEVRSIVEEGVGLHGLRWDRRPSRQAEEAVLDAIERTLKEAH